MCHVGDIVCYFCNTKIVTDSLIQRCEAYALTCFGRHELRQEDLQVEWADFSQFLPQDVPVPVFDFKDCPFKRIAAFKVYDYPCPNAACKKAPEKRSDDKIPNSFVRTCDLVTHFYAPDLVPLVKWFNKYLENYNKSTGRGRRLIAPFEANQNPDLLKTVAGPVYRDPTTEELAKHKMEEKAQRLKKPVQAKAIVIDTSVPVDEDSSSVEISGDNDSLFGDNEAVSTLVNQTTAQVEGAITHNQSAEQIEVDIIDVNTADGCNMTDLDCDIEAALGDAFDEEGSSAIAVQPAQTLPQDKNISTVLQMGANNISTHAQEHTQVEVEA
ncbi:hypothetical protein ACHAQH_003532 [Verticillium albo-atrum]